MSSVESKLDERETWFGLPVYWEEAPAFPRITSGFLVAGALGFLAVELLVAPEQLRTARGIGPALLALMAAVAQLMVWRGKVRAATFVLIFGVWSYVSVVSWFTGGLRSNPVFIYPLIIVMAGWRLGPAFGRLLASLTALVCLGFFLGESTGALKVPAANPPILLLVVEVGAIAFCTFMMSALVRSYRSRLDDVSRLGENLAASAAQVVAREAELNQAQSVARIGSWTYDLATDTARLSPEACRIFDVAGGDRISRKELLQHVHPDDRAMLAKTWPAAGAGHAPVELDYRVAAGQEMRWVRQVTRIDVDPQGKPLRALGTVQDVTERKRMDAELERHRLHLEDLVQQRTAELLATEARASRILESSASGLYGIDNENRITFINHAACRMLGYSIEQVLGRNAHELFHHSRPDGSPYPAEQCIAHQAWRGGQEVRVDNETYWHADGHPVPVALATNPIVEQGKTVGTVISVMDMSAQHAAARAREQALIAAESLARARSEFLANMSHEIRTPMNGVLGFAQIGYRNYRDSEKARNAFEKIIASGTHLLATVNEILDFSKIDAGKLQIERTDMSVVEEIDHALQDVTDLARAKGLDLRLEMAPDFPPRCSGDPTRFGQVLRNLLANAVKFTEAGSVTLAASRQGEQLVFRVTDTGLGMTKDQIDFVFNPFQQADGSTTRKFGGTGLGLAICKRLLELMKGEIRVDSQPGVGSSFEFRLPYVPAGEHSAANPEALASLPDKPLAGLSILLAEDDPVNQMMLETNLTEYGARLVMVGDGREAVERVISDGPGAYDIVLMDVQMPKMDGYEATRRILQEAPDLPVIGQTAHAFDEDRDKCLAAGMVAHIAKPIDPRALARLVLRIVTEKRKQ